MDVTPDVTGHPKHREEWARTSHTVCGNPCPTQPRTTTYHPLRQPVRKQRKPTPPRPIPLSPAQHVTHAITPRFQAVGAEMVR